MKKYKYSKLDECIYYDKMENGLDVYVIPTTAKDSFYAVLGVKYGSSDTEFIPKGKDEYIKTNDGIAHFLEHKAFEMENGEDPFNFFAQTGANANASTSFYATKYYAWGVKEVERNVDYLLTYVLSPHFTDENVQKEQGIISEEIRMYEDDPGWAIDDLARKIAFNELPIRSKISGTYETIGKITKEELYDCYNTFYVPNNMTLIVAGNVSYEKIFETVKNNKKLKQLDGKSEIRRKVYHEDNLVGSEYKSLEMNVCIPKLKYLFKLNRDEFTLKDRVKLDMYLNMIGIIIFGSTSEFYEKIRNEKIANGYYLDHNYYDKFYTYEFDAESDKADIFKEEVDKYLANMEINEKDLERMKRVWIASEIKLSDNCDMLAENVFDDLLYYDKVCYDRIDIIRSLNIKELRQVIKEINLLNNCFILVNPK